jgi:hypothetical protein
MPGERRGDQPLVMADVLVVVTISVGGIEQRHAGGERRIEHRG